VPQYPSRRELVRELPNGPDCVGISFNLVTLHRMKEAVALVRKHAPPPRSSCAGKVGVVTFMV
jgi:hypothetical protein